MKATLWFGLTTNSFVKETSISRCTRKLPNIAFFIGSNFLYGSSYMSSCPRQLHYSWQLKHYLGPHNHRAVHMTYCLLAPFAGQAPTNKCMQSLGSWCFDSSIRPDSRRLLGNPLSQASVHMSRLRVDTKGACFCPTARRRWVQPCTMHIGESNHV